MKTDKIFWGIIFIFVGGIFLLENFEIIDFSWRYVWHFWPLLLIITGINIIFSRTNSKVGAISIATITILALGFLTFKGLDKKPAQNNRWSWNFSDDDDNEAWDTDSNDRKNNITNYSEDFDAKYKTATLNVYGGASTFVINAGNDKLFESAIKESRVRYFLKKTDNDSSAVLEFRSKNRSGSFNLKDEEYGRAKMKIHTAPIWDINLKMGAGKTDFDFSENKVKNISLKGGAAEFNVKLGSLYNDVNFTAETGVAEVIISIPESVGCQIHTSTGLSSKDFEGFVKNSDGSYETPNYKSSSTKIHLNLKGGLSDFEVNRY